MVLALGPGMSSLVTMELLKSREGSGAGSADQMFLVLLDRSESEWLADDNAASLHKRKHVTSLWKTCCVQITFWDNVWTLKGFLHFKWYLSSVEGSCIGGREGGRAGAAWPDPLPPWKTVVALSWYISGVGIQQFQKSHRLVAKDILPKHRHSQSTFSWRFASSLFFSPPLTVLAASNTSTTSSTSSTACSLNPQLLVPRNWIWHWTN